MMKSYFLPSLSLLLLVHHHQFASSLLQPSKIRVLSLDVTGTLLATREPAVRSYYNAAIWAKISNPPSEAQFSQEDASFFNGSKKAKKTLQTTTIEGGLLPRTKDRVQPLIADIQNRHVHKPDENNIIALLFIEKVSIKGH